MQISQSNKKSAGLPEPDDFAPYTGRDVAEPQRRTLSQLDITKASVGPKDNNAYLLECRSTGGSLLIDAAAEPETLLALLAGRRPRYIVTTHRHADHWQALRSVRELTGARSVAHRWDAPAIDAPIDLAVEEGDALRFGEAELEVIHLVGHTPGSIA
ncbi:MAG: MBL fold metallo-hydrolase, partial [Pseudonocardiaceae bacterium]